MYCKNCGNEIYEYQEFCLKCLSINPDFKENSKTKKKIIIPYIPWLIVVFIILIMTMTTSSSIITDLLMILVSIFFIFLISLFLGIINPNFVIRWQIPEKRNRKNVLLYYGIGALVLYVIIRGFAYFSLVNDNISSNNTQSSANYTQEEAIKVTAKDLYNDYNINQVNADNNYKGKVVILTGEVSNITSTGDEICIGLLGNSITQFSCYFDNNQSNSIGELRKGQTITIEGRLRGKSWNICIDDCVLR